MIKFNKWALWFNVFLLIFATFVFLKGIIENPLWFDEGWSVDVARTPDLWGRLSAGEGGLHPPFFYFIQHYNPWLTGQLFTPRLISVFATLVTLALTFRVATDIFDRKVGLTAVTLLLTNDLVIGLAPLIRHYNLYMMLATLATWFYWQYSQRWQHKWGIAYLITAILLLYTLYWGAFILIAHGLHALLFHPRQIHRMLIVGGITGLAYIPWLPILLDISSASESGYHSAITLNWAGVEILVYHLFGIPYNIFILLSLAGFAGNLNTAHWRDYLPNKKTMLVGLWLTVPLILPIIITLFFDYGLLNHRSMVGMVPAVSILIAHVLVQLRRWAFNLIFAVLVINNLSTTGFSGPPLGPWWEMGAATADCMGKNDLLVIESNDILQLVTFEQHAELAGIPRDSIYEVKRQKDPNLTQIRTKLKQDTSIDTVCWVEYLDHFRSINPHQFLGDLGFSQTAPPVNFPQNSPAYDKRYVLLDEINIWHFSREMDTEQIIDFGGILSLQKAEHFQRNDHLYLDLLWKAKTAIEQDYTISAFLLSPEGVLIRQHDSFPLEGKNMTSTWQTDMLYSDRRSLDIADLPSGRYQIGLQVYLWPDVVNLLITPCEEVDGCRYIILDTVNIK